MMSSAPVIRHKTPDATAIACSSSVIASVIPELSLSNVSLSASSSPSYDALNARINIPVINGPKPRTYI